MIGIVIATHGNLGDGLKSALEVIVGDATNIATVSLQAKDDVNELSNKIITAIKQVDDQDGVIIACDVMCASPYNQAVIAKHQLNQDNIKIVSGVNLPMLLEIVNQQFIATNIEEAINPIIESAKLGIDSYKESINLEEDEF